MKFISFLPIAVLIISTLVQATEETLSRGCRVGLSANSLLRPGFNGSEPTVAPGLIGVYEFYLTPRFTLGIDLEVRRYPGEEGQRGFSQIGYGLLMKHSFARIEKATPYLEYGLLMNVTRRPGLSHGAMSHDTRLTVGADLPLGRFPGFAEVSYHYSKLDYFNEPRIDLDYVQMTIGWRFYE